MEKNEVSVEKKDFSVKEDNLTFNFLKWIKLESLVDSRVIRKIIVFSLITWFPLLIFSFIEGTAYGTRVTIPLLLDYATYTKFLVTLPLYFVCEKFVKKLTSESIFYFVKSGVISDNNMLRFEFLINKYRKLLNSNMVEISILLFSIIFLISRELLFKSLGEETSWKSSDISDLSLYTKAGYWYLFVSFPITQFILFRMMWKFFIWVWLLWKISNMELNLLYTNPDKAGGLTFLGPTQLAFGIMGLAQAASFSGQIASQVIYSHIPLLDFKVSIVVTILLISLFYFSPLFFFTKNLMMLKLKGLYEFGILTHKYGYLFEKKWLRTEEFQKSAKEYAREDLLGSGDIQSLTDIGGSYERIQEIRFVPFNLISFALMIVLIAIPFVPLATLIFPVSELVKMLMGVLI